MRSSAGAEGDSHTIAKVALLVVATAVAYSPCLHGAFILDDRALISASPVVTAPNGLSRIWLGAEAVDYWPVFNSSLWLQWRLWGENTVGYHVTNLAVHICDALLLWAILQRLALPGAFFAALLFALHPVNVASVAWIAQLKNLLAMTFALLSVLWFLRADTPGPHRQPASAPAIGLWFVASLAAFVMAMLSKGSVAFLPLVLLGIIIWRRRLVSRDLLRLAPFAVVSIGLALVTTWFRARFAREPRPLGVTDQLLEAAAAFWFYLCKALLPINLAFFYPKWDVRADELRWWVPLLTAVGVTVVLWATHASPLRRNRATWTRPVLFAWVFFGVALAPALTLSAAGFMEKWSVADHYQHVAVIAVVVLLAAGWATWRQRAGRRQRRLADAAAAIVVGAFGLLTWQQSRLYADPVILYATSVQRAPGSAFAHHALGLALLSASRPEEAAKQFKSALLVRPDLLDAHTDLAAALTQLQRYPEAVAHLREVLRLKPDSAEAENNLGGVLWETGQRAEAIEHYERALRLRPDYPEARYNLGLALYSDGRRRDAIDHLRRAVLDNPHYAAAQGALGVALAESGERDEAIYHLREAVRLEPDNRAARDNLDEILAGPGR